MARQSTLPFSCGDEDLGLPGEEVQGGGSRSSEDRRRDSLCSRLALPVPGQGGCFPTATATGQLGAPECRGDLSRTELVRQSR